MLPAAFVPLVQGSIATNALPDGDTPGAKGNTMHGLVNALGIISKTPVVRHGNVEHRTDLDDLARCDTE